jgi:hypothetical protein
MRRVTDPMLIVGAPLLLAIVECFHPHLHQPLDLDTPRWLAVHYAQIPLFALAALAVAQLLRGQHDWAATLCRVALFVFATSYIAFDTAAGVVTGILVQQAQASPQPESWLPAIEAVWNHPIVGGSPASAALLGALGAVALSVSGVTAALSLRRASVSWAPLLLLALAGFGITIFRTHAWPGGPLTFGGIALAAAWVLRERSHQAVPLPSES